MSVGMRQFNAAGIGKQIRVGWPGHSVQLIAEVIVLVPDDEVRVAALLRVVTAAVGIRSVLVIAFNHGD